MPRERGQIIPTPARPLESRRSSRRRRAWRLADSEHAERAPPTPCHCPLPLRSAPWWYVEQPVAPAGKRAASLRSAQSCPAAAHTPALLPVREAPRFPPCRLTVLRGSQQIRSGADPALRCPPHLRG